MIITSSAMSALRTAWNADFNKGFEGAKSRYLDIAMVAKSHNAKSAYAWLGQMPTIREWLGDRRLKSLEAFSFTIENKDFETTVSLSRNDVMDDNLGIYSPIMQEMGRSAAMHRDELVFGLLPKGFTSPCYDNQNFFDASHPVADANGNPATASNMQAGTGEGWYLLDTSRVIRPLIYQERQPYKFVALDQPSDEPVFMAKTYIYGCDGRSNAGYGMWQMAFGSKADLSIANYVAARSSMISLRGNEGKLLGIRPTVCVVSPNLEDKARSIFEKQNLTGGEANIYYRQVEVIVADWLAN